MDGSAEAALNPNLAKMWAAAFDAPGHSTDDKVRVCVPTDGWMHTFTSLLLGHAALVKD